MKPSGDIEAFARAIGHEFQRPELLIRALTHSSLSSPTRGDNQRLEFLGDRVLGLAIAEALVRGDLDASEGQMAPRLNALVRGETLAEIAREIGLGQVLKLGRSEMMSGGRRKEALLADALEAVLAAVYLDGGWEAARDLVLRLWGGRLRSVQADLRDAKTILQEWAQAQGMSPPRYEQIARSGPDHAPCFRMAAVLEDGRRAEAEGNGTKRSVEQAAAQALLEQLGAT